MKPPLFHVGQAVVCVEAHDDNDAIFGAQAGIQFPELHHIYHVRQNVSADKGPAIRLKEIVNPVIQFLSKACEPNFLEKCFAPVEEMPAEAYAELLEALKPVTA